jgi:hypothetical protein
VPAWIGLQPVRRQVAIYGQVSDAQTGLPIQGALVEIGKMPEAFQKWLALRSKQYGTDWDRMSERPDRTRTAVDGHFHFLDLPDGEYTLTASLPGAGTRYGTAQVTVTVSREDGGKIARNSADMALPPTAIKGHIAAANESPVVMAKIQIEGSAELAFSDSKGNYLLSGLEAGKLGAKRTVNVRVSASGCQPEPKSAHISQGEVTVLDWEVV